MNKWAIQIEQLSVNHGKTSVLWEIQAKVPTGKLVAIVGPNGAGKSTLMKSMMGLIRPLSGRVLFWGRPLNEVQRRVAYVPQRDSVDWNFPITVLQLVLMGVYRRLPWWKWPSKKDRERALGCLERMGLETMASRQINQLSGGQKQRLFLARAMMQEADLYLLDEPLAGVDASSEQVIMGWLKECCLNQKSVFVVHHDLNTVQSYFDWLLLLNKRLVACGPTEEVFSQEMIQKTYGGHAQLLDHVSKLAQQKQAGIIDA